MSRSEISVLDTGCLPISGSAEVIYSYPCGIDTAIFPLSAELIEGTVCTPFPCISTAPSLDFGPVPAGDSVTQWITLSNTTNDTVTVGPITIVGNDASQFTNSTLLSSVTIPPEGSTEIAIKFLMPANASKANYAASLIAAEASSDTKFICDTLSVSLTASLFIPANVSNVPTQQTMDFSLLPNPASGAVTVVLSKNETVTVAIYDVLGNLILRKNVTGQYVWSGDTPNGMAASGVYIVRVTERAPDGSNDVSSKRLIWER